MQRETPLLTVSRLAMGVETRRLAQVKRQGSRSVKVTQSKPESVSAKELARGSAEVG